MNDMARIAADDAVALDEPPAHSLARKTGGGLRPWLKWSVMLSLPLLIVAGGVYLWLTSGKTVSTDNAYVGAHVVSISPEVTGRIIDVAVVENQKVRKGDLLYRLDPAPFRIALEQAQAAVDSAKLSITQMRSTYSAKVATIGEKGSDVALAQQNYDRQAELMKKGFTTHASFDAAHAALEAARAQQATASSEAASAQAMLGVSKDGGHPQVEAAMAQRDKAALDLARTEVRAPSDGTVSQTDKLNPGATAVNMLPNLTLVRAGDYWIEANFKETQLAKIRIGQPARIELDAIPGRTFAGHVIGIGSGTGSEFSVLPAQNATGNWVKVTQRVPVRIALDQIADRPLVAGWSAHVTVEVTR